MRGTYADPEGQTFVENCGNTLILGCSAGERRGTAEFASRLIGKREVLRRTHSNGDPHLFSKAEQTHTVTEQYVTEGAVVPSEIEQLPDLTGYLKLASRPEWPQAYLGYWSQTHKAPYQTRAATRQHRQGY